MKEYKVTATMDVGYTAIIEAESEDEAYAIAKGNRFQEPCFEKTDDGHDWTIENITEITNERV
tara:strand:- start:202 stop:390 length:189 start_codon:yes stop_codon:yes gene_type:complete